MSAIQFPKLPEYSAIWAPVYLEPIEGSGERITIAIAAVDRDGVRRVHSTLTDTQLRSFLGNQAGQLTGVIGIVVESLSEHIKQNGEIAGWQAPLSGLTIGDIRATRATDMAAVIRMGIADSAFLAAMPDQLEVETDDIEISGSERDRWADLVQAVVANRAPDLVRYFRQSFRLQPLARRTHIDFVGHRYAANLARVVPDRELSRHVKDAKVKLWDLDALKTSAVAPEVFGAAPQRFELLAYRPADDDPSFSAKAIERLKEALLELEDAGDRHELRVRPVFTPVEAAELVIGSEAA